jgi:hypothetical protein
MLNGRPARSANMSVSHSNPRESPVYVLKGKGFDSAKQITLEVSDEA